MTITAERLRELLNYDVETGVFRWRVAMSRRVTAGAVAGHRNSRGYIEIGIGYRPYLAHRLAWLYVHGVWPAGQIDHRDGDTSNNRIANLREATASQNRANAKRNKQSTSGFKGVIRYRGRWRATITKHGKLIFLGSFETAELAHAAYLAAATDHFGDFARGG